MLSTLNLESLFADAVKEHLGIVHQLDRQRQKLQDAANRMTKALLQGGKILWCGNGGSAADAQHLAAELVGRFRSERRALPSIALTADTSVLTAIANDCGFELVFARQVNALGTRGDI